MSGNVTEGFDWLPSGASVATMSALMEAKGWYLRGNGPQFGTMQGCSLVTGRFGYGQRIRVQAGSAGHDVAMRCKAIGSHNSGGGYVSASINVQGDSGEPAVLGVYDLVNDQVLVCASFHSNGVVRVWTGGLPSTYFGGGGGTQIGVSEAAQFNANADIDVECFFKVHNTAGEVEVRVNTKGRGGPTTSTPAIHLINVDTQPGGNAYFDSVFWGNNADSAVGCDFYIDDFRYYDTAGSVNNSWLGTARVQTLLPTGAGATTDFSRSNTGLANWQNASNRNVDDSLYVYDPAVGDFDLYTMQPLVNSPTVFWVQMTSFVRQDDATQRYFKNRLVSASTTSDGASYALSQTYTADTDIWELDPATGLTFTGAAVNALQTGPYVYA
jgi:hypothetical protein